MRASRSFCESLPASLVLAAVLSIAVGPAPPVASAETVRAWLGVVLGESDVASSDPTALAVPGVVLRGVFEGSPAESIGLRAKDRIVSLDGEPVASARDLIATMERRGPGDWVSLRVVRKNRDLDLRVRLQAKPRDVSPRKLVEGSIGADVIDLPPALRAHFGAPEDAGVMISSIAPGSPAVVAGLSLGDVVFAVDDQPVRSRSEWSRLISGGGVGNTVEIHLSRSGAGIVCEARIEKVPPRER